MPTKRPPDGTQALVDYVAKEALRSKARRDKKRAAGLPTHPERIPPEQEPYELDHEYEVRLTAWQDETEKAGRSL